MTTIEELNVDGQGVILIIRPESLFKGRFKNLAVKLTSFQVETQLISMFFLAHESMESATKLMGEVCANLLKYTDRELIDMDLNDLRFLDWCTDVVVYASCRFVLMGEEIPFQMDDKDISVILQAQKLRVQKAVKLRLQEHFESGIVGQLKKEITAFEAEQKEAERLSIQLELEVAEQQRIAELVKAEEKHKKDAEKEKAKATAREASKRNLPPYPPSQKPKGVKDNSMISNVNAQKKWLMKYVPDWNGQIWSKKQAEHHIKYSKERILGLEGVVAASIINISVG